jgi:hypothetical protein
LASIERDMVKSFRKRPYVSSLIFDDQMDDSREMAKANRREFFQELNIQHTANVQKFMACRIKPGLVDHPNKEDDVFGNPKDYRKPNTNHQISDDDSKRGHDSSSEQVAARLLLSFLRQGTHLLYDSSIEWGEASFWFRCYADSFVLPTLGKCFFVNIWKMLTYGNSRMVILYFNTPNNMLQMRFERLKDANTFREQLRPHVNSVFDR